MTVSIFDLFSIGIGPSSSHTVGPMRAALTFGRSLEVCPSELRVHLYGSLALTGVGHGTDRAILLGLEGETPQDVDLEDLSARVESIIKSKFLRFLGGDRVSFQLHFHKDLFLPFHANAMRFQAFRDGSLAKEEVYYSIGGGFILDHESAMQGALDELLTPGPYPFRTGQELLDLSAKTKMSFAEIMWENEKEWRSSEEIRQGILSIWQAMQESVERGCHREGILPGGLGVKRRAPGMYKRLSTITTTDPVELMDWVSLWALAVNEENAAGGRIVTAPTNGAAGILPAVLHFYMRFTDGASEDGILTFLLTAAAVGVLFKEGASISAAEVGCQGEVGVACSMAAAGLAAVWGANPLQVEEAAEIGMEHNLGLTCDPVGGLVQIPCIERNTMGAVKAIAAARLALQGDGTHQVSLDQVIKTMLQTGRDMQSIYKETSQGGLAVNVIEC